MRDHSASRSRLAEVARAGIRMAHREDDNHTSRDLRRLGRGLLEIIKKKEGANTRKYIRVFRERGEKVRIQVEAENNAQNGAPRRNCRTTRILESGTPSGANLLATLRDIPRHRLHTSSAYPRCMAINGTLHGPTTAEVSA